MSVLDSILAGVAGGLEGGVRGYQLTQDLKDRKLYRQQLQDDRLQRQRDRDEDRRIREQNERRAEAADAERRRQAQRAARLEIINSLPESPHKRDLLAAYANEIFGADGPAAESAPSPRVEPPLVPPAVDSALPGLAAVPYVSQYDQTFGEAADRGASREAVARAGFTPADFARSTPEDPHLAIEPTLPARVRARFHAQGHKTTGFTDDDFLSDNELRQRETADADRKLNDHLRTVEGEERIRQKYRIPVTPRTDDPKMPNGVKQYLATLPGKYGGDSAAAGDELARALPDLTRDHPQLDLAKLRAEFSALFPKPAADGRNSLDKIREALAGGTHGGGRGMSPGAPSMDELAAQREAQKRGDALRRAGGDAPVSDDDLRTLARSELVGRGADPSGAEIEQYVAQNGDVLRQRIAAVRGGRPEPLPQPAAPPGPAGRRPSDVPSAALPQPAAPGSATNPALAGLATRAQTLLSQFQRETDPSRKAAMASELRSIRQQLGAARSQPAVTDDQLQARAAAVLKAHGRPVTPATIQAFIGSNRELLMRELTGAGGGR